MSAITGELVLGGSGDRRGGPVDQAGHNRVHDGAGADRGRRAGQPGVIISVFPAAMGKLCRRGGWQGPLRIILVLLVGWLGMRRRGVHDPHRVISVIWQVPDPAARGHLDLPLLKRLTPEFPRRQTAAQPIVALIMRRSRAGPHQLERLTGVHPRVLAQIIPAACCFTGAESDVPLLPDGWWRDVIKALWAHRSAVRHGAVVGAV
jgi:hypothetical protein